MRVFLTGATGFIGSRVAERLARRGHITRCLVRPSTDISSLSKLGAEIVRGDLRDRDSVRHGVDGCDALVHLAAAYDFWLPDRRAFRDLNVTGTRHVMQAALDAGVRKAVHVSSVVIFGNARGKILTETLEPGSTRFSEYARTKYEGDQTAWALYRERGLPLVVVYPGAVLGPGDTKPSGQYLDALLTGGLPATVFEHAIFPCVHVDDVAEAIVRALERPDNIGERYLVVGENLTFGEINALVHDISGVALPKIRMPDAMAMAAARALTWWANRTGRRPLWGMAIDQMLTMQHALPADAGKSIRELGLTYTPIRTAIEQVVARRRKP